MYSAPTSIYTLSLHDALPIFPCLMQRVSLLFGAVRRGLYRRLPRGVITSPPMSPSQPVGPTTAPNRTIDRKSTRLNSSHVAISYAVFCLKKKKKKQQKI